MEDKLESKPLVRVLIVDDSKAVRSMVNRWLSHEPSIRVVSEAEDGYQALTASKVYDPDVVVLDVEMPGISGIEALKKIRAYDPDKIVIMFSATTHKGAAATIEALSMGAADYVTKPTSDKGVELTRLDLVSKILALGTQRRRSRVVNPANRFGAPPTLKEKVLDKEGFSKTPVDASKRSKVYRRDHGQKETDTNATKKVSTSLNGATSGAKISSLPKSKSEAVVIASSTGGPAALSEVIPKLPLDLKVPILIVQHMPPLFAEMLAERLDGRCPLEVKIAEENDRVRPGVVYIAPGGRHLEVERKGVHEVVCHLSDNPPEQSCRPSANVLFRSAASVWRKQLLGVVLTGMGADGCEGSRLIVEGGGTVIIQDEATSVIWGMPGAVAKAGYASAQFPLDQIAKEIYLNTKISDRLVEARLGNK